MAFGQGFSKAPDKIMDSVLAVVLTLAGGYAVIIALNLLLPGAIENLSELLTVVTTASTGNAFFDAMLVITGIIVSVLGAFWVLGFITDALRRPRSGGSS